MGAQGAIKLHRRGLWLDGASWTVLSLRPGEPVTFATNRGDAPGHVLGDGDAAALLARLFWALAFQRRERTLMLIDGVALVPDPFDGAPSSAIALANADLGIPTGAVLDELRARIPLTEPSLGTVKLRTAGLERALADPEGADASPALRASGSWTDRGNGIVAYAASGELLRAQALVLARATASAEPTVLI